MHDPFPLPCPLLLQDLVRPIALRLGLPTLPLHLHELLFAAAAYTLIHTHVSPFLSARLFPRTYPAFPLRTKINWDVHVVAFVQSIFICFVAFYILMNDEERSDSGRMSGAEGARERIWGYTGAGGMLQAFAAGYFLWDLGICIRHFRIFGLGLLVHAIAALAVFSFGFRPFVNFYGPIFILYELSSPFLNAHWFFDKLQMTGSRPQWYNGILLLTSFLCCRLLWGTYQSFRVYQDVITVLRAPYYGAKADIGTTFEPLGEADEVMRYVGNYDLPAWLAWIYILSNAALNGLNFFWYNKMIKTVRSRFEDKNLVGDKKKKDNLSSGADLADGVMVDGLVNSNSIGFLGERGIEDGANSRAVQASGYDKAGLTKHKA